MDFTRKARWVLDGHKTPDAIGSTYAGVVSRKSVCIALTYAALNDLDVFAANIQHAYLEAPWSQKDCIICGPEFGVKNIGRTALIHRALYGGKAAGRDFRNHLHSFMEFLNFKSCLADPDVWMRLAIKSDGNTYYEYILLYVDDALVVSENAESILRNELGRYFHLKQESIGPPTIYLGGRVRKVQLENNVWAWSFSSSQYVQSAVKNVEEYVGKPENSHLKIPTKAERPLTTSYRPELDVSPEVTPQDSAYYQSLIGILWWIVELGRIDICLEVSMMSPRCLGKDISSRCYIYLPTYASITTLSWLMTRVTKLWNKMFSNEETGHPLSLVLCKGRRRFRPICQSREDWDL